MTTTPYVQFPADHTQCPRCQQYPQILAPKTFGLGMPTFYVCRCGYMGQMGVGPVEARQNDPVGAHD